MKFLQFKKIRTKILVSLLPVTIVLLIALCVISYQSSKQLIDAEIVNKMDYKLDHTIALIQDTLDNHSKIGVTMSRMVEVSGRTMTREDYKELLPNFITANPETLGLGVWFEPNRYQADLKYFGPYVYREGASIVYTEDYEDPAYDYFSQSWYSQAVDTDKAVVWSDPFFDPVTKTTMVTAAAPFHDQNGKFLGMTSADIDMTSLQTMVQNIKIGETGHAFLLTQDGHYIAGDETIKPMEANILEDPNLSLAAIGPEIISGSRASGEFEAEDGKNSVYYAPIAETGWVIGLSISQDELYQPLGALMVKLIGVILFIIFAISMLVLFFSNYITRNINKVVAYGAALGTGDLSQTIDVDATDEIGTMANAFEQMADSMREKAAVFQQISDGDLSMEIVPRSERDVLTVSMQTVVRTLRGLAEETRTLAGAAVEGKLDVRGDTRRFSGVYREIIQGMNDTLDAVIGPLNVAAEYVDRISKGDIPPRISDDYRGDFNEIKNNLNTCIDAVHALVEDARMLSEAAVQGRLDARADGARHEGDFRRIIDGVNQTLDAVIGPLNVAAEYVDRISKGDIPAKISDSYHGDFNEIKNNLNTCIDAVQALVEDAAMLSEAAVQGRLDARADGARHEGDFRRIIEGVNDTLDAVIGPLNVAAEYVERISKGDIPAKISDSYNGDFNEIKNNLNTCIDAVDALVADARMLASAAVAGKFETRADGSRHSGDFRKIVDGVNETLDTVVEKSYWYEAILDSVPFPISVTDNDLRWTFINKAVSQAIRISRQEAIGQPCSKWNAAICGTEKCGVTCLGHNQPQTRFEQGGLNFQVDSAYIKNARGETVGHIEIVQDTTAKVRIAEYMQTEVDRLAGNLQHLSNGNLELDVMVADGDQYTTVERESFLNINRNLEIARRAVKALVDDAAALSQAAVAGQLDTRADAGKHQGDFRRIVEGVNLTLDAVIDPLNVAAQYVDRISKGDVPEKITQNYNGDFNLIKNNLNNCIDGLGGLLEANRVLQAMAVNDHTLSVQGSYLGVYAEVGEAVNQVRDRLLNMTSTVNNIARGDISDLARYKTINNGLGRRSENDHIVPAFIMMMEAIKGMIDDAAMLSQAAVDGQLSTRADENRHQGDFRRIVEGVNQTLDAVIAPINEASAVLQEMAAGNLRLRMVGDYRGDHAEIKVALNGTLDSLAAYVDEIAQVLTEMAHSNLDMEIAADYKGDFQPIKEALNLILTNFNQILADFNSTADQVATGSRQVSDGSQALSQGATEQASAIQQLTASINEIAVQTRQNAVSASEANGLAATAQHNAVQGNEQMKEMLKAMEEINLSSANISKIIKVIDEIAFQTNILALNAAVEAARAGQHGKGFAVVAEEVRNLAARSAGAAKETTGLIEGSLDKVSVGTRIAKETAGALDRIVSDVAKAADLVGSIASASNQQATGIAQVNQGVEQVAQVVQTNSATAEESAAASEELSSQAELLKEMINGFRLKDDGQGRMLKGQALKLLGSASQPRKKSGPRIALSDLEFGKY